ncbi:MBL fold metallo-hydrolase [Grimontia kaedaensis]|uniref:MBL fold metallo-hydrolase n=1 Tax=Grimontia kaedaensis TaxID=2872157 RepID=A0ABY4X032_9GAMM|nr:MBL fold metallo-hydrolase [Grimontia kaedaensis]USH04613.1 MBL fold metallo-hydrolase [Grimontia kaedaensis]
MKVQPFFHAETGSLTYVVSDSGLALIIDPVLDYKNGDISHSHIDHVLDYIKHKGLELRFVLDTHIHADHLSASHYVKLATGAKMVVSQRIREVFQQWKKKLGLENLATFDFLVSGKSKIHFGSKIIEVIETPGHTPACVTYKIDDNIFVGDTLFAPDKGTSRADFPGGSAEALYNSIQKLYELPNNTNVYLCHDYPPIGSAPTTCVKIDWQKRRNIMLNQNTSIYEYVFARSQRDASLKEPKLLNVAVPYNLTFKLPEK